MLSRHSVANILNYACVFPLSSWPFSLTDSIQPVALRVTRPLISLVKSFKSKFPKWITKIELKYLAKCKYWNLLITSRISLNILSSSLVFVHVQSNVICFTIFHNNWPLFSVCTSTERPRIELVEGALLDVFCSMYSVSCKVVNFHHYFPSAFALYLVLNSNNMLSPDITCGSRQHWEPLAPFSEHQWQNPLFIVLQ